MHPCSLISTFVAHCLDSIISLFALAKISRLQLVSVAQQAGFLHALPEDRFSHDVAQVLTSSGVITASLYVILCRLDTSLSFGTGLHFKKRQLIS